jgi:hypothetical protein
MKHGKNKHSESPVHSLTRAIDKLHVVSPIQSLTHAMAEIHVDSPISGVKIPVIHHPITPDDNPILTDDGDQDKHHRNTDDCICMNGIKDGWIWKVETIWCHNRKPGYMFEIYNGIERKIAFFKPHLDLYQVNAILSQNPKTFLDELRYTR